MGWNTINIQVQHPLLKDIENEEFFYFVHSYYAPQTLYTIASCDYISYFSAIVSKNNFYGVQFHPEKSGKSGAKILKNFVELVYS